MVMLSVISIAVLLYFLSFLVFTERRRSRSRSRERKKGGGQSKYDSKFKKKNSLVNKLRYEILELW